MNYPIRTNKLNLNIDHEKFDKIYDIFQLTTSDTYFKSGAYILDAPVLENSVQSICFTWGKSFYVLMYSDSGNLFRLKTLIAGEKDADKITIEKVCSNNIYNEILLQLLINALSSAKNKLLSFNNLTGHFYAFNSNWIKRQKINGIDSIVKIPCMDVKIAPGMRVQLNIKTFTSLKLKKFMGISDNRISDYPKYVLSLNNTLRRKMKNDDRDEFIIRQTNGSKTEIPFLDLKNIDCFNATKLGVLANVIDLFNKKYSDFSSIDFEIIENYESVEYTNYKARENREIILSILSSQKIKIIDCIKDDYSKKFIDNVICTFYKKFSVDIKSGMQIDTNALNIRVIHNKAYYNGINDPYIESKENAAIQHITFEDFSDNSEAAVATIVNELLVKHDLVNRKITLFNWRELDFDGDITFGMCLPVDKIDKYYFMTIKPNGSFDIKEQEFDLFNINEYSECVNIFEDNKRCFEKIKGVIKDSKGNINIIRDTSWYSIPEIDKLKSELKNGNTYLRNKEKRHELISSCNDIKYFRTDKEAYYFTGVIGNGMRARVSQACNIRKIESYKNSEIFFEKMLPLMNVSFVRNGQLTVIPFPFKYLREYISNAQ